MNKTPKIKNLKKSSQKVNLSLKQNQSQLLGMNFTKRLILQ